MADQYGVNESGSYAILYCVLISFTILAFVASSFIPVPAAVRKFFVSQSKDGHTTVKDDSGGDFFLSARNSADG